MSQLLPGGFPEHLPSDQASENLMRDSIRRVYERYGYVNIETPAVELTSVLTSKVDGEVTKQIYGLFGQKQWPTDAKDFALRFDLTVPLARYVVENESELQFPFKRYHIWKVWRGETQGKWKFKEFIQCDVDVIDENLNERYDIEVVETLFRAILESFSSLWMKKLPEVHINDRRILDQAMVDLQIPSEKQAQLLHILDWYYKMTSGEFETKLIASFGSSSDSIRSFIEWWFETIASLSPEMSLLVGNLMKKVEALKSQNVNVVPDICIVRDLSYYTGMIFETFITDFYEFWSVCSGGRYENLVQSIRSLTDTGKWRQPKNFGWVGGSIWLSRLFSRLKSEGLIREGIAQTDVLIFNTPGTSDLYREKIAWVLRSSWIRTDIYYQDAKLSKQFSYAEKKWVPFGVFAWPEEEKNDSLVLKNLGNREQSMLNLGNLIDVMRQQIQIIL
jgi:histidyl-tRNA synthetase